MQDIQNHGKVYIQRPYLKVQDLNLSQSQLFHQKVDSSGLSNKKVVSHLEHQTVKLTLNICLCR